MLMIPAMTHHSSQVVSRLLPFVTGQTLNVDGGPHPL